MAASNKEDTGPAAWVHRLALVAVAYGLAAGGGVDASWAASSEPLSDSRPWNEYEREAVRIATEFTAAWDTGDTQKGASYVGKNFEYHSDSSHGLTDCADTNCDDDPALPGPEAVPLPAPGPQ